MRAGGGKTAELDLLRRIRARALELPGSGLRLGIGDDCALLRVGTDEELAVTTDLSIAGRHFNLAWHSPESIGHRTLARGLSDLAAMGARPVAAFLSLGLPAELVQSRRKASWVERFLDGLLALARTYGTPLAGGDLAEAPVAVADIVLTGAVQRGKALLRSGARAGDLLYVTGGLGGSAWGLTRLAELAAGLKVRAGTPRIPAALQSLLMPHLFPQPRIAQGLWLARRGMATSAIDLSDGLSTDLAHLCEESSVGAEIDVSALPVHSGASLKQALHGGEDYELLFTARASARVPLRIAGVPVTRIGRVTGVRQGRPAIALVTDRGPVPLVRQGWEHFS